MYVVFIFAGASGSLTHMLIRRLAVKMIQEHHLIVFRNLGLVISVEDGEARLDPRGWGGCGAGSGRGGPEGTGLRPSLPELLHLAHREPPSSRCLSGAVRFLRPSRQGR